MNVIAGKYRGKKLKALEGMNTRPTSARVKEDMFNILSNYFIYEGKTSLDLFGGSGALSLEGLSRGVKFAYINDHYKPAVNIIKENFAKVPKQDYELTQLEYEMLMQKLIVQNKKVDLIYLDPPFPHIEYYYDFFKTISENNLLNENGVVLVEAPEPLDMDKITSLKLLKEKAYKSKVNKYIYVFRNQGEK